MRKARLVLAAAGTAVLLLSACGDRNKTPQLMNIRSDEGPDEFAIIPPKPLQMPESLEDLPEPTPGGSNLTDPTPHEDAIVALGGKPPASNGVPAGDGALYNHATRFGLAADIRTVLAAEDLEWRRKNNGRILERLLNVNVYYKSYRKQSLDQHAELARWRKAGVLTPSAPPRKAKEE